MPMTPLIWAAAAARRWGRPLDAAARAARGAGELARRVPRRGFTRGAEAPGLASPPAELLPPLPLLSSSMCALN